MARTTTASATRRTTAFDHLTKLADVTSDARATAKRAQSALQKGMLKAHRAGLTYQEIADVCGITPVRVGQVLAEQRNGR